MKTDRKSLFLLIFLAAFSGVMLWGAGEQVKRGNGFLWIPSSTLTSSPSPVPSATRTASPSPVPSATQTSSPSPVPSATRTAAPSPMPSATQTSSPFPSATATQIPTATAYPSYTPLPTLDKTVFAETVFADLTGTAVSYALSQTPVPTKIPADEDLTTGLCRKNPTDGKTLIFIQSPNTERYGFWVDTAAVTKEEYAACVLAGACECTAMASSSGVSNINSVVNVSRSQASAYCKWAEMDLLPPSDWYTALKTFSPGEGSPDLHLTGEIWEWTADPNGLILGGSQKSSAWDLSHHRYEARMTPDSSAEDVGFRCAADVPRN